MLKQEFVKEEYDLYVESIKPLLSGIQKEYGSKAIPGYVLLNKDKQPKQCMNSRLIPITDAKEMAKYNSMSVLPSDIIVMSGNKLYKKIMGNFWGKHTNASIIKMFEKKELTDLNAVGTGEFFVTVDIDTKNINENTPSLAEIEASLPKTLVAATPTGGKHYHFVLPKGSTIPSSSTLPCVDILGKGKLVVVPGQEREGKGHYTWDTQNPNFSFEMAPWSEEIRDKVIGLFNRESSLSTLPLGYLDTSSVSQEKGKNVKNSREPRKSLDGSTQFIKDSVRLAMQKNSKVKIEEGMRNSAVFYYCCYIADHTPASQLLSKALEFNQNQLAKPLSAREVEGIVKSCLRSFSCYARPASSAQAGQAYNGKSADVMKAEKSKFQNLHQELNGILVNTPKSEEFAGKIEDITSAIQTFFEVKFQKAYSRTIPSSEVGKILRAAGFEKKKVQKGGVRAWLWNFDSTSIKHLEAVVEAMKPQVAPEAPQAPAEAPIELNVQSTIQSKEVDCSTSEQARMNERLIDEMFEQLGLAMQKPRTQSFAWTPRPLRNVTSFAGRVQDHRQIQQAL